jgi:hypothetical protein
MIGDKFLHCNNSEFYTLGILADESTRGSTKVFVICFMYWNEKKNFPDMSLVEMKDLIACSNAKTVAQAIIDTCSKYLINTRLCLTFLSDNTNYMAGKNGGAVKLFSQIAKNQCFRIPCSLHVAHIILTTFEDIAFGKLTTSIGFSKQYHPFNLLYLVWELHNGYDKTDKDKPLGMKAEIIYNLYKTRLNFDMNQYQKPMRSRWLYELKTAEQYLKCKQAHIQFVEWFIPKLCTLKTPKSYLNKWRLFQTWLNDPQLNIQIKCLVKFGKEFYEPMMTFLNGFDPQPKIFIENNEFVPLPPGYRAHEMPEAVIRWIREPKFIAENIHDFFGEELLEATEMLTEQQVEKLIENLELAAKRSLEVFQKWMNCWLHLPLSICRLGGSYGHEFAKAYANVILDLHWSNIPTLHQLVYKKILENDIEEGTTNDFGLSDALADPIFQNEFIHYAQNQNTNLHEYSHLYNFVKNRIWYIIVHQQQIEGLFNKYDIKTHPNMKQELQQSKLRLSFGSNLLENINKDDIKKVREQRKCQPLCNLSSKNNADIVSQNANQLEAKQIEEADRLFDKYFPKKK